MYTHPPLHFCSNFGWKNCALYTRLYGNLKFKRDHENKIIVKITGYKVKSCYAIFDQDEYGINY